MVTIEIGSYCTIERQISIIFFFEYVQVFLTLKLITEVLIYEGNNNYEIAAVVLFMSITIT